MIITLEGQRGESYDIFVKKLSAVLELKKELASVINVEDKRIIVIFEGRVLLDERTLESYGVQEGNKVFYVVLPEVEKKEKAKKKAFSQEEPETFVDKIASSPFGKEMLNMMENNPDFYTTMFKGLPNFQAMSDKNPEINHMLNDPEQMSEVMRANMTKGNKKQAALSLDNMLNQVEQSPIGLHMVNRMMNDVTEPLMDGIFGQQEHSIVIPTEGLSAPAEAPLPGSSPNLTAMMKPATKEDREKCEKILQAIAKIKEAIQKAELAGISFPKKDKVIVKLNEENRRVSIQGNIEALKKLYPQHLKYLKDIGFTCEQDNIAALTEAKGEVKKAISLLMKHTRLGKSRA